MVLLLICLLLLQVQASPVEEKSIDFDTIFEEKTATEDMVINETGTDIDYRIENQHTMEQEFWIDHQ